MCRIIKIGLQLPVVLTILFLLAMFSIEAVCVGCRIDAALAAVVPYIIFFFSAFIIAYACLLFWREKTTANPITPENASTLVTTGIYGISRNPIYLGFLSILIASAFLFSNYINFFLLPLFVLLVNKMYISGEEKALESIFGNEFIAYKSKVRRWV
ncbi:MAG: hypothetical protein COB22_06520 [Cycloclasticus sp.]|nr:MAG: hypothetical protein COB22_06520 [Cycloclasticus sp.]